MNKLIDRGSSRDKETGAVTAEFAVVLPAVVFILALVLGACAVGLTQVKLEESARIAARAAARGESSQTVERLAREVEPATEIALSSDGEMVQVSVSKPAPGAIGAMTGWELTAVAVTPAEGGASHD
ncbi:TadE family type IV pilus minor pilin [Rothia aerolata]|uniref:TadE-like domain-containing protein n=1 Tax=Rothia aerolata TaxID=1812262 RepID=A0A917MSP6_9MICC|nr:TadE family type IV pilus minor pilin [Rothia aerolata]GGH61168.1 hypothetical protein GCM10007359_10090 [Rothia aerolata]